MKKKSLLALALVFALSSFVHAQDCSPDQPAQSDGTDLSILGSKVCLDNRDCIPSSEHCINHFCEPLSHQCTYDYECAYGQSCRNGQCN